MPLFDNAAPVTPFQAVSAGLVPAEVFGIAIAFNANRTPLVSRVRKQPCGSLSFKVTGDDYRGNSALTAGYASGGTTLTVADSSPFQPGDVLEVDSEAFRVTAVPTATTITVAGAYAGTTAANHSIAAPVYLIGRATTGAEVGTTGISRVPIATDQYLQTFQQTYSVGGAIESARNYALPPGFANAVDRDRAYAMQHVMDDMERSSFYGYGVPLAGATTQQAQKGIRSLLVTNKILSGATNASAYKPSDLIRDTLQRCRQNGGNPDVMFVSSDWLTGLAVWSLPFQYLDPGEVEFGVRPQTLYCPFLGPVAIVEAPLLRPGTVICLTSGEVSLRVKRPMFDKPRGSRGDATEGDIIAEAAIEVDNEQHHAWVSGITGFAKQS